MPTITAITHHVGVVSLSRTFKLMVYLKLEDIVSAKARENGGMTGIVDIYKWMNYVALEMVGQAGKSEIEVLFGFLTQSYLRRTGMGTSFGVMEGEEPEYLEAARQLLYANFSGEEHGDTRLTT
jgi:hypothetical protein